METMKIITISSNDKNKSFKKNSKKKIASNKLLAMPFQTNANFLSANTSFYTQTQSNANFLSANTSYYTQLQTNNNFLSANTSYYTQSYINNNYYNTVSATVNIDIIYLMNNCKFLL